MKLLQGNYYISNSKALKLGELSANAEAKSKAPRMSTATENSSQH